MGKLLFWLVVLFGIGLYLYTAFKLKKRRAELHHAPPLRTHETVRCAHCDAFVSQAQAVQRNGKRYCSWDHADADAKARTP